MGRMDAIQVPPPSGALAGEAVGAPEQDGSHGLLHTLQYLALATRPRRIVALIILLWILNFFDLTYTIFAHEIGGFEELNPLAHRLLDTSWLLTAFKLGAVAGGSTILLLLRRHRIAELVCWCLCVVYTVLAFMWMKYYSILS